jgi:hypothetical protein
MQVTEVAREDPLQLNRNTVQEQTAVVAFTALYYSGLPFQVLEADMPLMRLMHMWRALSCLAIFSLNSS